MDLWPGLRKIRIDKFTRLHLQRIWRYSGAMGKKSKPDKRALRMAKAAKLRLQVCALCYRWTPGGKLHILMVTSRRTRRWIAPKGWPMRGKSHAEAAAQEALEEAGAIGKIAKKPMGYFEYRKHLGGKKSVMCLVQVFPMEVKKLRSEFRESGQRKVKWMTPKKAIACSDPRGFSRLIKSFAKNAKPPANEEKGADQPEKTTPPSMTNA